ncbi:hypothetical protein B7P43_G05893, partial [Cryptotermes secundus]
SYRTRRFLTVFTRALYWSLSGAISFQYKSTPLFPSSFPTKSCMLSSSAMRVTRTANLILLDTTILITVGERNNL